ncbi:Gfo/Idh/MocA family oxidoreductase [Saccharophagus degradans]|uniref:Gfo/Idh/MocA family protein n=1 Tax=Saccharophagus degradans TaxID=86304 RepID=UPI001C08DD40|nr:Gfo/Idh/MocA family oxidoreductase [Saccharophagus degradans]MBU2987681.1 Gfo/Idh/MocA family oxidoreductase [Saccharophagus degradans]
MKKACRWGLIGPGLIAERFAKSLTFVEGASLYAVASRDAERASTFAAKHSVAKAYHNYTDLVADKQVDAVYICTPHRFHYQQIKMCLLAGKPVLCEKPLTVNAAEAKELMALAKSAGVFLMEAMWTPFLPVYQQLSAWLAEGCIGDIKSMQSSFGFAVARQASGRYLNHDVAGGVLLDMGMYNVAISQWLMKRKPEVIQAQGLIGSTRVDEMVSAQLNYGAGVVSQFICSFQSQLSNTFSVCGSLGRITVQPYFWDNGSISLELNSGRAETKTLPFRGAGFEYEIEHAQECIEKGLIESPIIKFELSLQTLEVMDEIRAQIGMIYDFE